MLRLGFDGISEETLIAPAFYRSSEVRMYLDFYVSPVLYTSICFLGPMWKRLAIAFLSSLVALIWKQSVRKLEDMLVRH